MVVYWDLVMLFNFLVDYLLLYSAMRLSGRDIGRKRLLLGATLGALCAVVQLLLPRSFFLMALVFLAIGALAFYGSGRAIKLTLLFLMLSCAFAGGVLLLGQLGGMEQLARGIVYADLPWGVFFGAAGLSYLVFCIAFRGSAAQNRGDLATVDITCGDKRVSLRLLRDTGNTLRGSDGIGVPVISKGAIKALCMDSNCTDDLPYRSVGQQSGTLKTISCDRFLCDGQETAIRRIAVSDNEFGDSFVGILPQEIAMEEKYVQKPMAKA